MSHDGDTLVAKLAERDRRRVWTAHGIPFLMRTERERLGGPQASDKERLRLRDIRSQESDRDRRLAVVEAPSGAVSALVKGQDRGGRISCDFNPWIALEAIARCETAFWHVAFFARSKMLGEIIDLGHVATARRQEQGIVPPVRGDLDRVAVDDLAHSRMNPLYHPPIVPEFRESARALGRCKRITFCNVLRPVLDQALGHCKRVLSKVTTQKDADTPPADVLERFLDIGSLPPASVPFDTEVREAEKQALIAAARLSAVKDQAEAIETKFRIQAAEIDRDRQLAHELRLRKRWRRLETLRAREEEKKVLDAINRPAAGAVSARAFRLDMPTERVPVGDLPAMRAMLVAEFPHAAAVIDAVLAPLAGRPSVWIRPTLFVGAPGSGKSRFARRLAEVLGLHIWRVDASREGSNAFAGTERRWTSAEPCHPLMAIQRAKHLNPVVFIDELEKTAVSTRNGRLWDALLGFLERENASRYPDPYYQQPVDLSGISYLAAANGREIPAPLLDRFRVFEFPEPGPEHLPALIPRIVAEIAADADLPAGWYPPINGEELASIEAAWSHRSIRTLRALVEAVIAARDLAAARH